MSDPRDMPRPRASSGTLSWIGHLQPWVATLLVAAVALVALLSLGWLVDILATGGRIHPGVKVGGVAVGGQEPSEAARILGESFTRGQKTPVRVHYRSRQWKIGPETVGARIDARASAAAALRVGRDGSWLGDSFDRMRAWFGAVDVSARVTGDALEVERFVEGVEASVAVPAKDATAVVSGRSVRLIAAKPGIALHHRRLRDDVLAAFASTDRDVHVVTGVWPVRVTDEDAAPALDEAKRLMSGPVSVVYSGKRTSIAASVLSSCIGFRQAPYGAAASLPASVAVGGASPSTAAVPVRRGVVPRMVLQACFVPSALGDALRAFTKGTGRPALDAKIVAEEGVVTIRPGQRGVGPDFPGLAEDLRTRLLAGERRVGILRTTSVEPRFSTEDARARGIRERIGKFTTTFSSGNAARVNNIHTLAKALDYTYLKPGQTFSFNRRVGPRTAAKGYKEAPAIVDGKLEPQLGGGICQVGTTIFNSVFFSGLPILERRNHSFYISHYPKGRDCTISWGGPDFKFKNDTGHWLLIRASYTSSSLTMSLYGTDPGYGVEYTTSDFTRVVPHRVIKKKDPLIPRGMKSVEEEGVDGGVVTVVRTVYRNGQVVRKDEFVSHYKPKDEVVRIGTKAPSVPTTQTAG